MAAPARAPTPSHTREFTREGVLTKQGHAVKNWRSRYFTLDRAGVLTYYESESVKKAKGSHNVVGGDVYVFDGKGEPVRTGGGADSNWGVIIDEGEDARVPVAKRAATAGEVASSVRMLASFREGHFIAVTSPSEGDVMLLRADSASVRDDWAASLAAASHRGGGFAAGRVHVRTRGTFGKSWLPRYAVLAGATLSVFEEQPFPIDPASPASFLVGKRPKALTTFSMLASGGAFIVYSKEGLDAAAAAAGVTLPPSAVTVGGADTPASGEGEVGSSSPPVSRTTSVARPEDAPVAAMSIVGGNSRSGALASTAAVARAVVEVRDCARTPAHTHVIVVACGDGAGLVTFACMSEAAAQAWTRALRSSVRGDPPPRRASLSAAASLAATSYTTTTTTAPAATTPASEPVPTAPAALPVVVAVSSAPLSLADAPSSRSSDASDESSRMRALLAEVAHLRDMEKARAARAEEERHEADRARRDAEVEAARQAMLAKEAIAMLEEERKRSAAGYARPAHPVQEVAPLPHEEPKVEVVHNIPPPPPNKPSRPPSRRITGEDAAVLQVPPAVVVPSPPTPAAVEADPAPVVIPTIVAPPPPAPIDIAPDVAAIADGASAWTCDADGPERAAMRKRIFEYLLRRTPASTNAAQAEYLQLDVVPSVESALYVDAAGDRDAYLDVSTLKPRLKRVFEQRASGGAAAMPSSFAAMAAAPSPMHDTRDTHVPAPAPVPAVMQPPVSHGAFHALDTSSDSIASTDLPPLPLSNMSAGEEGVAASDRSARRSDSKRVVFVDGAPVTAPASSRTSLNGASDGRAPVVGILKGGTTSRSSSRNSSLVPAAAAAEAHAAVRATEDAAVIVAPATPPAAEPAPPAEEGASPVPTASTDASASESNSSARRRMWMAASASSNNLESPSPSRPTSVRSTKSGASDDEDATVAPARRVPSSTSTSSPASSTYVTRAALAPRWGRSPHPYDLVHPATAVIRHYPSQADGSLHLSLIMERRPAEPPHLPTLNKWQHRQCADCGVTQTTGMFGVHASLCHYTELLFCPACMSTAARPLPWRVVQDLDDSEFPVCGAAATYIDSIWNAPLVALSAVAPRTLARAAPLQQIMQLRARLADVIEAITTAAAAEMQAPSPREEDDAPPDGELPSEVLPPVEAAASRSHSAAGIYSDCVFLAKRELGRKLEFMAESVELLPLSVIVVASTRSGGSRIIPRLQAALRAVLKFADASGFAEAARAVAAGANAMYADAGGEGEVVRGSTSSHGGSFLSSGPSTPERGSTAAPGSPAAFTLTSPPREPRTRFDDDEPDEEGEGDTPDRKRGVAAASNGGATRAASSRGGAAVAAGSRYGAPKR